MSSSLVYRIVSDLLPEGSCRVAAVRIVEELNRPYVAEIRLTIDDPTFDLTVLPGSDLSLVISRDPDERVVCGLVADVRDTHFERDGRPARLLLTPALALLELRRNTRMFQEKTVPEILETVLGESLGIYGRPFRNELRATYPRREYCVQYRETDLEFVHRLMEEEGIGYTFDHLGTMEELVLRDDNAAYPEAPGNIEFDPTDHYVRDVDPIHTFALRRGTTTTSVVVRDWDWTRGGDMVVEAEQRSEDEVGRDRESYEHGAGRTLRNFGYENPSYQENDSARQKEIRQQAHAIGALVGVGLSRVIGLAPGTTFTLSGHPTAGNDGEYFVTRVVHTSQRPEIFAGEGRTGNGEHYHNQFQCVPVASTYRPARRASKPRISGIQTAVVTGPSGEEIHVDEHGRIKVQFHWDRENPADETSSCWARCQQTWAGNGWGFWWVPRIGMEVVVQFVDGDPDRPLVTGCVYNGTNALPYPLPDEKTKSTIKSNSSLGGGGSNEFRFEDKAGSEEIFTHAQKDYNEVVEHDHNTLVHHDQTNTVDVDQTQEIGANQTEKVHGWQKMTVDGNRTVHVKSNFTETVDGTETRKTTGNVTETFDANEDRKISGSVTETITGNETRTITGNQDETISGSQTVTVTGSGTQTITGSLSQTITGGITATTPASYAITAVGGMTITAPAGITLMAPGGLTVAAPGGVMQVDSQFEWVGVKKLDASGFASAATILKIEVTGVSHSTSGVKIDGTLVELGKAMIEDKNRGAAMRTAASRIGNAAIAILKALPHVMI